MEGNRNPSERARKALCQAARRCPKANEGHGGRHVHVSITHLKELAAAQAIIEGEPVGFDETGEGATVGNDDAVEGETVSCGESAEGETVGNGKDEEVEPACNDEGTD